MRDPGNVNPSQAEYTLCVYSGLAKIDLKRTLSKLDNKAAQHNPDCVIYEFGTTAQILIYAFGSVVFFNVTSDSHADFLDKIVLANNQEHSFTDDYHLSEDEFIIKINNSLKKANVCFNHVELPTLTNGAIQIVSLALAKSNALELIESRVEQLIHESEKHIQGLKRSNFTIAKRKRLLGFLSRALTARHRIVTQLALLDIPETTWESESLYELYFEVYDNLDVPDRIEVAEKMLEIAFSSSSFLLDMMNTKRGEQLEWIIIILIAIEIVIFVGDLAFS